MDKVKPEPGAIRHVPADMSSALEKHHQLEAADQAAEQRRRKKHQEKIDRIVEAIDSILAKENCSFFNWSEIIEVFNKRNMVSLNNIKMQEIKERSYAKHD